MQKWFLAIGIIFNAKKGVSSYQLARDLSINQKSAWYLGMRIRVALKTDTTGLLSGIVEADECYVGGGQALGGTRTTRYSALHAVEAPGSSRWSG